jgi:hypothetical protein
MRHVIILYGVLIAGLLNTHAFASHEVHPSQAPGGELPKPQTSLGLHREALRNYEAVATELKKRIQVHETRLANLTAKPYWDPKGFLRFSAKLLASHLRSEVEKIEQMIAWHQEQIEQLQS